MGNSASASALPYTIEEEVEPCTRNGSNGWAIHNGARKSDGLRVSVFKASKPNLLQTPVSSGSNYFAGHSGGSMTVGKTKVDPNSQFFPALHHFTKIKTLVHPHILKAYATLDTDDASSATGGGAQSNTPTPATGIAAARMPGCGTTGDFIIVTEEVMPLSKWLDQVACSDDMNDMDIYNGIAWGLSCIIQGLSFLHMNAKLAHAAISPDSIFVTPGGDFKIGYFGLLSPVGSDDHNGQAAAIAEYFKMYEGNLCPAAYRSPERVNGEHDFILRSLPPHVMDSYSLGEFLEHIYGCVGNGKLPDKLVKAVSRLKTPSATQRPRVGPLMRCPVFDVPLVKSMAFLDEIYVKPAEEKVAYFLSLPDQLSRNVLTPDAAKYKLLPNLILCLNTITSNPQAMMQDVVRREVLAIIPPFFSTAEMLDDTAYSAQIAPLISTLFQLNDRGVRGALLGRLSTMVSRLDQKSLNSCVFEPMCTGFTDSSGALRELTLKSTVSIIPHLTAGNLEKLVRYLVRLQSDQEDSIRTNTVIFISKIAPSLSNVARSKLILPAFIRAMKDPFTPCRLAGLKSIMQCREYFDPSSIATKVLPCMVPHLMDSTSQVRNEAFAVLDQFTVVLKQESKRLEGEDVDEWDAPASETPTSGSTLPTSSSGGYMSGLTSWASSAMTKSASKTDVDNSKDATESRPQEHQQSQRTNVPSSNPYQVYNSNQGNVQNTNNAASNGWSDDEDNIPSNDPFEKDIFSKSGDLTKPNWVGGANDAGRSSANSMANKNPASNDDSVEDFFSSNMVGGMKIGGVGSSKAAVAGGKKLVVPKTGKKLSMEDRKKEFAARKAQREKQLQEKKLQEQNKTKSGLDAGWDDF